VQTAEKYVDFYLDNCEAICNYVQFGEGSAEGAAPPPQQFLNFQ